MRAVHPSPLRHDHSCHPANPLPTLRAVSAWMQVAPTADARLAHTALTLLEGASREGSRAASAPQSRCAAASRLTV